MENSKFIKKNKGLVISEILVIVALIFIIFGITYLVLEVKKTAERTSDSAIEQSLKNAQSIATRDLIFKNNDEICEDGNIQRILNVRNTAGKCFDGKDFWLFYAEIKNGNFYCIDNKGRVGEVFQEPNENSNSCL